MNEYVKSPLNYTGGKYKLLPQIIPLFPNNIDKFLDLFGGSGTVSANVKANKIICNDINKQVIKILQTIKDDDISDIINQIDYYTNKYNLSKDNVSGYMELRKDYNLDKENWIMLYTLICHCFNNQIRFNSKGDFNMPFGRRYFNTSLKDNLIKFSDRIKKQNIYFTNLSFEDIIIQNGFIYADPPYLNSDSVYNESTLIKGWCETDEIKLLNLLDIADSNGLKFALSNNLKYNNVLLDIWRQKYKTHYLNMDYNNCNYQKKNKSQDKEILITNY